MNVPDQYKLRRKRTCQVRNIFDNFTENIIKSQSTVHHENFRRKISAQFRAASETNTYTHRRTHIGTPSAPFVWLVITMLNVQFISLRYSLLLEKITYLFLRGRNDPMCACITV